ncbi:MAG: endonuclease III domain-containing protein [Deltaproteobacteria bacterium]|nr:endonuclease III domain-containing protein [Deltaproteobacteria bacterium]
MTTDSCRGQGTERPTISRRPDSLIRFIRQRLDEHFGPLDWWPADSPFEVAVGAILTQNTAWTNVEYAIGNLKHAGVLDPEGLAGLASEKLEGLIRPAGFFRQKACRLQNLARHLVTDWRGDITALCSGPLASARGRLLALAGIGPETADSILLYAAARPSFVVDAYTRRIFQRIGLLQGNESYDEIRRLFMQHLPEKVTLYNQYHAQIVQLAKTCCRKKSPLCRACPLHQACLHGRQLQPS